MPILFRIISIWLLLSNLIITNFIQASETEFIIHPEPDPEFNSTLYDGWDGGETDAGGVVFHDGQFHMFYNGMVRAFNPYSTGYAHSDDSIGWTRISTEPILKLEDTGHIGKNITSNSALVQEDGTWVLYLTVTPSARKYMGYIIRATAPQPMGSWSVDPTPVLLPGQDEDWDGDAAGHASVNRVAQGYVMHYVGLGTEKVGNFVEEHARIGMAHSSDGVNWVKYNDPETNTALTVNSDPVFEVDDDGWTMIYRSNPSMDRGNIGFATSSDGIHWQRFSDNPIATERMVGESGIWFANYVRRDGIDYVWFEAGWIDTTRIYLMTRGL